MPIFRKAYTGEEIFEAVKASLNQHIKTEPVRRKFEIDLGDFGSASFKMNDNVVLPLLDRVIKLVCVTCDADNILIDIHKKNQGFDVVTLQFDGKKPNVKNDDVWGDDEREVFYPLVQDAQNLRCSLFWHKLHGPTSLHFEFPLKIVGEKNHIDAPHAFPARS